MDGPSVPSMYELFTRVLACELRETLVRGGDVAQGESGWRSASLEVVIFRSHIGVQNR